MKKLILIALAAVLAACGQSPKGSGREKLAGAGATFPLPYYNLAIKTYRDSVPAEVSYGGIGSGGGIRSLKDRIVDFAGSDAYLTDAEMATMPDSVIHIPTCMGAVVMAYNLPGVEKLKLTGELVADIYLGKIKKWDDEAIAKLNPGLKLPSQNIAVVRRADGSGTSFVFTSYLSKVNEEWKSKIGAGSTVNWPTGLGGKGNDGIAAFVQRLPGSIGYVEYAYAKQNNLAYTKLVSADGKPVSPTEDNFANAAKGVDWSKSFAQDLTNQKGENAWPITSTTFILVHKATNKPEQTAEVLKFFDWAYKNGGKEANALDYATLPESVVEQVRAAWKTNVKDSSGKALY